MNEVEIIPLSLIYAGAHRLRRTQPERVAEIARSIEHLGLNSPITVRTCRRTRDGVEIDTWEIVAGHHRVDALRKLGRADAPCMIWERDDVQARMWEISENLHRAELTALERDEHVAEWIKLSKEEGVLAQVAPKPLGGRPESGVRRAAREIGVDRDDARRAEQVAELSPEAKQAARDAGFDDNRTALLAAAREPDAVTQVAEIERRAQARADLRKSGDAIVKDESADAAAVIICDNLPDDTREQLMLHLDACGCSRATKAVHRLLVYRNGPQDRTDRAVFDNTRAGEA